VKQQWLVGLNQELIEGEPDGADVGYEGREPEDAAGDLVELGFPGWVLSFLGAV
jgi:hypothetical protein